MMETEEITFSFGRNWTDFLDSVGEEEVARAISDIEEWLGRENVQESRVLDIGSGSGLHSLGFLRLGASAVHSFDYDPHSVSATGKVWEQAGSPSNWKVEHGSILDREYVERLGHYDIVYSWGVLHHTGKMWEAIENAFSRVKPGGLVWISLYQKGPRYPKDLELKRRYNAASEFGKRWMVRTRILRIMLSRLRHFKNPFAWNEKSARGMNRYHDLIDWLGGLPYETASEDEVVRKALDYDLVLQRISVVNEGGCSKYVFRHSTRPLG